MALFKILKSELCLELLIDHTKFESSSMSSHYKTGNGRFDPVILMKSDNLSNLSGINSKDHLTLRDFTSIDNFIEFKSVSEVYSKVRTVMVDLNRKMLYNNSCRNFNSLCSNEFNFNTTSWNPTTDSYPTTVDHKKFEYTKYHYIRSRLSITFIKDNKLFEFTISKITYKNTTRDYNKSNIGFMAMVNSAGRFKVGNGFIVNYINNQLSNSLVWKWKCVESFLSGYSNYDISNIPRCFLGYIDFNKLRDTRLHGFENMDEFQRTLDNSKYQINTGSLRFFKELGYLPNDEIIKFIQFYKLTDYKWFTPSLFNHIVHNFESLKDNNHQLMISLIEVYNNFVDNQGTNLAINSCGNLVQTLGVVKAGPLSYQATSGEIPIDSCKITRRFRSKSDTSSRLILANQVLNKLLKVALNENIKKIRSFN